MSTPWWEERPSVEVLKPPPTRRTYAPREAISSAVATTVSRRGRGCQASYEGTGAGSAPDVVSACVVETLGLRLHLKRAGVAHGCAMRGHFRVPTTFG